MLSFGRGFSPLGPTQGTQGPRLVGLEVLRPPLCQGGQLQFPKQSWASSGSDALRVGIPSFIFIFTT